MQTHESSVTALQESHASALQKSALQKSFTCLYCNKCEKRPITIWKETYYNMKRDLLQYEKRPITTRITCLYFKRLSRLCIATNMKRDLLAYEKRPITIWKETYYNMKRDLLQYRKRPIAIRITCLYCKHLWRVCIATNMKRDLLVYEKRPITIKIMCLYCKHLTPSVLQTRHVFAFFHESALQESHVSA